jgi:hypothetical protein
MKRKIALLLSVVALSSLGGGVYAHAKTTPVAYVSVDINPSVELAVNTFDQVVSVEAYNEDGKKVLEGTNLKNSDVDDAVKIVISNAVSDGYIKKDDAKEDDTITTDTTATTSAAVEITVSTDKEDIADKLNKSLKETADKSLEDNNVEATAETQNVALARRDEARQLGITPGKLNLIQKLQELDPTIQVEDYKSSSVKDIQKKFKELKKMNKSDEITTDENTNTNTNTDTNANTDTNTNANANSDTNTDINAETNTKAVDAITKEKANNSANSYGMAKKEEHSNSNSKKEDDTTTVSDKEKDTTNKSEKTNNSSNSSAHNNNNKEKSKNN